MKVAGLCAMMLHLALAHHILLKNVNSNKAETKADKTQGVIDPSSCSNLHEIITHHISLDFDVLTSHKKMGPSSVTLEMEAIKEGTKEIWLDFDKLKISQILLV